MPRCCIAFTKVRDISFPGFRMACIRHWGDPRQFVNESAAQQYAKDYLKSRPEDYGKVEIVSVAEGRRLAAIMGYRYANYNRFYQRYDRPLLLSMEKKLMSSTWKMRVSNERLGVSLPGEVEIDVFRGMDGTLWTWTKRGQKTLCSSPDAGRFLRAHAINLSDTEKEWHAQILERSIPNTKAAEVEAKTKTEFKSRAGLMSQRRLAAQVAEQVAAEQAAATDAGVTVEVTETPVQDSSND